MKRLTSIVALNAQGAIGCQNTLPWRLKTDMQFFRSQTIHNLVIMGRKTLDSIGKPLAGRDNIVLSHNAVLFDNLENTKIATSIDQALVYAEMSKKKDIFVVGGASTYHQFSDYVDRYLITIVDKKVFDADAFFSEDIFGNEDDWTWKQVEGFDRSPLHDEVDFKIFEVMNVRPEKIALKRLHAIENYKTRYLNQSKSSRKVDRANTFVASELRF